VSYGLFGKMTGSSSRPWVARDSNRPSPTADAGADYAAGSTLTIHGVP
jgi:hypothetical protein